MERRQQSHEKKKHFDIPYAVSSPTVDFSGDKIIVTFTAQFGIIYDYAVVEFTPY